MYGIFISEQAQLLSAYCDVTVFVSRRKLLPSQRRYQIGKVNVIEQNGPFLPNSSEKRLSRWSQYYEKMYDIVTLENPIDIIHCHDYIALYPARKLSKKYKVPFVTTIHNTDFLFGKVAAWRNAYIKDAFAHSQRVIAVGQSLATALEVYAQKSNIQVIPNIIDTSRFGLGTPTSKQPFHFLFVGNYEPRKRVMMIIEAFNMLGEPNTTLTLYGYGTQKSSLQKYVREHALDSTVTINSTLPNNKLPEIYQSHHCYISVSTAETFGITVAEAMSCGMHIIYSKSGGPEHFVPDLGSIVVDPINAAALTNAMRLMINEYDDSLSAQIRQHAVDQFSAKKVINQILDLYRSSISLHQ